MKTPKDSFRQYILFSIGLHLFVLVFFTVKVIIFPRKKLEYQRAVRVDMVALPEKIKPQVPIKKEVKIPKPPPPKPKKPEKPKKKVVKKPKPKKPKPIVKKPKPKKAQNDALARLKALQKIKDQQKKQQETQKLEYKGNELSKGNSLTGLQKLQHTSYLGDLDNHIKNFWNLPEWLASESHKATVILYISSKGQIKSKRFITRSGNNLFDQYVDEALEKANPLPPPPPELVSFFSNKGVEIRFPE